MNSEEFVEVIKLVVRDGAIRSTLKILAEVPGRKPPQHLKDLSAWFNSLDSKDRRQIEGIVAEAVDMAVFSFLCVIDGVSAIENGPDKGALELRYIGKTTELLNSPDNHMLHEFYNSED